MAEYLSLEEAAQRIGISTDELNRLAQKREIRAFSESGSWRFRPEDIAAVISSRASDSVHDEDLTLGVEPTAIGMRESDGASDSDVQLAPSGDAGDSSVHGAEADSGSLALESGAFGDATAADSGSIRASSDSSGNLEFESGELDVNDFDSAEISLESDNARTQMDVPTGKEGGADLGQTVDLPVSSDADFNLDDDIEAGFKVEGDSDFELGGLDAEDSGKTKQMRPAADIFDEDSDVTARGPESGINLDSPVDSGLSLDSSDSKDDSEFELSLDSDSEADVFDTDDFEVAGFKDSDDDSGSNIQAQDSDSDFELEIDDDLSSEEESGSEVVAIDDDGDDYDDYDDESDSEFASPTAGVALARGSAEDEPWGGLVYGALIVNSVFLVMAGIMLHQLMRHSWSYTGDHILASPLIEWIKQITG